MQGESSSQAQTRRPCRRPSRGTEEVRRFLGLLGDHCHAEQFEVLLRLTLLRVIEVERAMRLSGL